MKKILVNGASAWDSEQSHHYVRLLSKLILNNFFIVVSL